MNIGTIIFGACCCLFGLFVLVMRLLGKDSMFKKLEPMRKMWGPRAGSIVHFVAYAVVPIVVGIAFVYFGTQGVGLFE